MKDYYQILGVPRGAADDEIKRSYRRLAKQYHPDVNKGDKAAEERFKGISEAYSVLSDKEKRKQYDMFGSGAFQGGFDPSQAYREYKWSTGDGPEGFRYNASEGGQGFDGVDLGDIFGDIFGMGGMNRQAGRKGPGQRARPKTGPVKGTDTFLSLDVDFKEAITGMSTRLSIMRGESVDKITVKIPAGVDNGSKVRVSGKGHPGLNGGPPGDLYLNIRVRSDKIFWREGADIFTELPISIYEAILGAKVDVPTIDGSAKMTVPSGTASGQKFRLKDKGAPVLGKKGTKGDQFVIVRIVLPEKIDSETKKVVEELAKKYPYNPRR